MQWSKDNLCPTKFILGWKTNLREEFIRRNGVDRCTLTISAGEGKTSTFQGERLLMTAIRVNKDLKCC